jgi:hypothetical protein
MTQTNINNSHMQDRKFQSYTTQIKLHPHDYQYFKPIFINLLIINLLIILNQFKPIQIKLHPHDYRISLTQTSGYMIHIDPGPV